MQRITQPDGRYRYTFSSTHPPVATLKPGERVRVVTEDAFGGRIESPDDRIEEMKGFDRCACE